MRQLAAQDRRVKLQALRALLAQEGGANGSDAELLTLARSSAASHKVSPADGSLDALLVAVARAQWLATNVRVDLF